VNRLSIRLALAMLLVAIVSFAAVPVAETIASRTTFASLPSTFRKQVIERTTPHLFFRTPSGPHQIGTAGSRLPRPATAVDGEAADQALATQNERLFELLGSFRAAQQRAVVIGIAAALLLGVLLALALSRNIAVPFEALTRAASKIAAGDFGTRMGLRGRRLQTREARQLTDGFNAMAASLETYEHERKAMVADIAHELRTPLATMQMRLDAIQDGLVPWDDSEAELLKLHMRQLARLVDDLRVLSLADAGRLSLRLEDVELREWLDGVSEALRDVARRGGCDLEIDATAADLWVRADADRLYQILRNLVDNAGEAMERGGTVRVSLRREGPDAVWSVRDRGPGIDPAQIDTLFERFSHGRRRDTRGGAGRGLGLAIVRTLVLLQGGSVTAANLDPGAEFTVRLPAIEAPRAS
jgi:signal transduction histidine kinase